MGEIYEMGVRNAPLTKISPALERELIYLGKIEQGIKKLERDVLAWLEEQQEKAKDE